MKFFAIALEEEISTRELMETIRTEHPDGKLIVKHLPRSTAQKVMNEY